MRSLRGANARAVIKRLNPIIRGWAAYYRPVVSSEVFSALDAYQWKLAYKWARYHPPEQAAVLGDRPVLRPVQHVQATTSGCSATAKAAPTSTSSPGPGSSDTQWSRARRPPTTPPWPTIGPADGAKRHPCRSTRPACGCFEAQHGRCQICGDWLLSDTDRPQNPHEWERWQLAARKTIITIATRADGTPDDTDTPSHTRPLPRPAPPAEATGPAPLHAREPPGLA